MADGTSKLIEQTFQTTDTHPFWVYSDQPVLFRKTRDSVTEHEVSTNTDVQFEHDNLYVTETGCRSSRTVWFAMEIKKNTGVNSLLLLTVIKKFTKLKHTLMDSLSHKVTIKYDAGRFVEASQLQLNEEFWDFIVMGYQFVLKNTAVSIRLLKSQWYEILSISMLMQYMRL